MLYTSFYEPISEFSDEELGQLFRAIFEYHDKGTLPALPPKIKLAFDFMKLQFEIDNQKYQNVVERNRTNGLRGGRPRSEKPKEPSGLSGNPEKPKKPDEDEDEDEDINTMPPAVEKKKPNVDNSEDKGFKSAAYILPDITNRKVDNSGIKTQWQDRAFHFCEKLKLKEEKDRRIVFKYFKQNMALMESICSYVLESPKEIKNPLGYVLNEFKRRHI